MMVFAVVRNTVRTSPNTNLFCKAGDIKQNRTEIILLTRPSLEHRSKVFILLALNSLHSFGLIIIVCYLYIFVFPYKVFISLAFFFLFFFSL